MLQPSALTGSPAAWRRAGKDVWCPGTQGTPTPCHPTAPHSSAILPWCCYGAGLQLSRGLYVGFQSRFANTKCFSLIFAPLGAPYHNPDPWQGPFHKHYLQDPRHSAVQAAQPIQSNIFFCSVPWSFLCQLALSSLLQCSPRAALPKFLPQQCCLMLSRRNPFGFPLPLLGCV